MTGVLLEECGIFTGYTCVMVGIVMNEWWILVTFINLKKTHLNFKVKHHPKQITI